MLTLILKGVRQFISDLVVDFAGDANASGLSQLLQASCHIHPLAVDIAITFNDDVSEIDANAELKGRSTTMSGF
nr:hypothetical protein [Microvirga ossetica]